MDDRILTFDCSLYPLVVSDVAQDLGTREPTRPTLHDGHGVAVAFDRLCNRTAKHAARAGDQNPHRPRRFIDTGIS